MKGHRTSSGSRMKDARSASLGGFDYSTSPAKSPGAMSMTMSREREWRRRTDSMDSTRFQVSEGLVSWKCRQTFYF